MITFEDLCSFISRVPNIYFLIGLELDGLQNLEFPIYNP